jgi:ribosomal protein S18 acetylase RimI-like enzyme
VFELRDDPPIDLEALARLRARCEFADKPVEYLARQVEGARWIVHAYDGDRLVGFARAISDGVSSAFLSSVMVDPDHRRCGIGRAMVERLLAGRDGIKFVLHARQGAAGFWAATGFVEAADMRVRDRTER